jgi:hypothetical protein
MNKSRKESLKALYWGQSVVFFADGYNNDTVCAATVQEDTSVLELYEPHSIIDEHAKIIAVQNKFNGTSEEAKIKVGRDILKRVLLSDQSLMCLPRETSDFMRHNGYALPYLDWSIADQVYSGVVRLITRTQEEMGAKL